MRDPNRTFILVGVLIVCAVTYFKREVRWVPLHITAWDSGRVVFFTWVYSARGNQGSRGCKDAEGGWRMFRSPDGWD